MMKSKVRYLLIMWVFMISAIVYLDRTNISIAGLSIAKDYGIGKIELGWVFSAFLLGYAGFQIPAGWIAGKVGPRLTLTLGMVWWGVFSVATTLVPSICASGTVMMSRSRITKSAYLPGVSDPVNCS